MPRKVIPDNEVEQLLRQGLSQVRVSEILREEFHIDVTPHAISMWRRRRGLPKVKARPDIIPWPVRTGHSSLWPAKMLRALARREAGEQLPGRVGVDLDRWLSKLDDGDLVVTYDPDTEQGWFYVRRRPGVDVGYVANPDVPVA